MSNYAGYAAVAQVRDTAINSTLTIFHRSGVFPTEITDSFNVSNPFGSGSISLNLTLFLDAPQLILEESRGAVLARFVLAGTVSLTGSGVPGSGTSRRIRFDLDIVFNPSAAVGAGGVAIRLLVAGASLTSYAARSVGGPVPASVMNVLNGNTVRNRVANLVTAAAAGLNSISPPLLVPFVDRVGIGTLVNVSGAAVKVLDGALAVGVDFSPGEAPFSTDGNFGEIESFLSQSDFAVCAHPSVRNLMRRIALPQIRAMAAEHEVDIDALTIQLAHDHLLITVHASKDDFGATLTMRAKVHLGRPEEVEEYDDEYGGQYVQVTPGTDDIWVKIWDVQVDVALPWWAYVLITVGVFALLPIGPVIIAAIVSIVETIKANVVNQIENGGGDTGNQRVQRVTLPGTEEPFVDITVSQIKTSPQGFQTRAWFKPVKVQNGGKIVGPKTSTVEELVDGDLSYSFTPDPMLWHPENPLVDARWQVRRADTNEVIQTQRLPITDSNALRISVNLGSPENIGSPKYKVNCTILRNGAPDETIVSDTLEIEVMDRLDRTRPFVQWDHTTCVPRIERVDGILRMLGWDYVNRSSKIHKTKLPGRCRMAGQYSPATWPISLHYADQLPFDPALLTENRTMLCDYCFFGGPDKTEPLPL